MIKLIPEQYRNKLSVAIAKGELDAVKDLIEQNNIDVDAFIDAEFFTPLVMKVLTSYGIKDESERLKMLTYCLDKGANPNLNCKDQYNCLHIAVQHEKLIKALNLFLDYGADVNQADSKGATVAYWALQGFPWRTEGDERQLHLKAIEKIMMLGADLDRRNKFGAAPRQWLERAPDDVKALVEKCEKLQPVYTPPKTVQPEFPSNLQYANVAKKIWKELVPPSGQAATVQGEMLRAVEKLRDEAQRNGNINYFDSHKQLALFVTDNLVKSQLFTKPEISKIKAESKKLQKPAAPYLEDDAYDYLTDRICEFYLKTEPIIHIKNPDIYC